MPLPGSTLHTAVDASETAVAEDEGIRGRHLLDQGPAGRAPLPQLLQREVGHPLHRRGSGTAPSQAPLLTGSPDDCHSPSPRTHSSRSDTRPRLLPSFSASQSVEPQATEPAARSCRVVGRMPAHLIRARGLLGGCQPERPGSIVPIWEQRRPGSAARRALISFSSAALIGCRVCSPSPTGPPRITKPSPTSRSMNSAVFARASCRGSGAAVPVRAVDQPHREMGHARSLPTARTTAFRSCPGGSTPATRTTYYAAIRRLARPGR